MTEITNYIQSNQKRIEAFLADHILPKGDNSLHQAMRYCVLGGGKRFRPLLAYATGEAFNANPHTLDYIAAAVELVHAYSLAHDDLPAMDDDELRHGKPSLHKAYNEATAILVGDALLSLAFEILTSKKLELDPKLQLHIIKHLAKASGPEGMVLGQALDMSPEEVTSTDRLQTIHFHKTGALLEASILMGAHASGISDEATLNSLETFSHHLGLAYQIQDDVLDLEASTEHLGKPAKSDIKQDKQTYAILLGIQEAKKQADQYYKEAFDQLAKINLQDSILAKLVQHFQKRNK